MPRGAPVLLLVALLATRTAGAQRATERSPERAFARLAAADSSRDARGFLAASRDVLAFFPAHPFAVHLVAIAYARTGDTTNALAQLERLAAMGDVRPIESDTAFVALRGSVRYARIIERLRRNREPVSRSTVALVIPDTNFLPESVARDSATGDFYLGSLARHAVVRFRRETNGSIGEQEIAGRPEGLLRVVGVKLDAARRRLWFATWEPAFDTAASPGRRVTHTRLFAKDLASGALTSYSLADSLHEHLLNDLVITSRGEVYLTDTAEGSLWRLAAGGAALEQVLAPERGVHDAANGITITPDERRLYVAFTQGIAAFDLGTKRLRFLALPDDVTTSGADGIYWYHNSLIAVQGLGTDERVVRFYLDSSGLRVIRAEVLERGAPSFRRPTTGVLVGDDFYFLPNAQYHRLADDGSVRPDPDAAPSRVMRLRLR